MSQNKRIGLAILVVVLIVGGITAVDLYRRQSMAEALELTPGSVPIYVDGDLVGGIMVADLERLAKSSFVDAEEGKTQEGWPLADILRLHLGDEELLAGSQIIVSSSSRGKTAVLTWAEIENPDNMLLFDLSGRGTLKLVSLLERLDTRDEWVQDTDKIEIKP
jgi:hypothetical protein